MFRTFTAILILAMLPMAVSAEIFDPLNCYVDVEAHGPFTIAPCGGDPVPRLDVYINDLNMNPVELLGTDIWLDSPSVMWCPGGEFADSSTYAPDPGHTTMTAYGHASLVAGDSCVNVEARVIAVGVIIDLFEFAGLNGPDHNNDLEVTLVDFAHFAGHFNGVNECMDYVESDGTVTVADFAVFASYFNDCVCQ